MADRGKVLKGLECCCSMTGEACRQCPYDEECAEMIGSGSAHLCSDALELLKEQQKQKFFVDSDGKITPLPIQPQWISVEDRMPPDDQMVIGYTPVDGYMFIGFHKTHKYSLKDASYSYSYWYIITSMRSTKHMHKKVTHWMPLPEPPEESHHETTKR